MERKREWQAKTGFSLPIAESTFRASISNSPTFQWGGRKNFNNSAANKSIVRSPARERTGLSKIDARIYTDVQSRGLASRIVKYHDSLSSQLNRSNSMINLSSESRQFPATRRISKPELPYRTGPKQNVSMTHIAPPSKSAFYGNTLSGLLRSSSVITLQQHNDDDVSSENRPIIHPPVTEKELQPTRSVLEVLKEISRKRINNEDGDETDTSKKYCNRIDGGGDLVNGSNQADYRNLIQTTPQTYKRQRESPAEYCCNASRTEENGYISKLTQNHQDVSPPEQQQASKRRQCNYSNDIASSLSSSRKCNNKRKLFDHEGGDTQQEKQIRYQQSQIRLPELSNALSYVAKTPITPLPNTPQSNNAVSPNELTAIPCPVAVQKNVSSAPIESVEARQLNSKPLKTVKPKLTLFNKNYKPNGEEAIEERTTEIGDGDACCAGIQFVKPKKKVSSTVAATASHVLMERTQKSKLALMLSGLRGELYLGDDEPVDKPVETQQKQTQEEQLSNTATNDTLKATVIDNNNQMTPTTMIKVPSTTAVAQLVLNTNTTDTKAAGANVVDSSKAPPSGGGGGGAFPILPIVKTTTNSTTSTSMTTTTTSSTKITSPLTGIKLTPQKSTATVTTVSQPPIASMASPTFSFGIGVSMPSTSTTNSTASNPNDTNLAGKTTNTTPFAMATIPQMTPAAADNTTKQSLLPTFGLATGQKMVSSPFTLQQPAVTTAPANFSFGTNTTVSTNASAITKTQTNTTTTVTPAQPVFSFGTSTTASAAATTQSVSTSTASAAAPFSFGGIKTPAVGGNAFSFGGTNTASASNTSSATETPTMFSFASSKGSSGGTGGFSFGGSNNTTDNKSTTNVFGGNTTNAASMFAAPTAEQPQQQKQNAFLAQTSSFVFGSKPAADTAAGQGKTTAATNSSNTFGSLMANNQNKPFSFGASNNGTTAETTAKTTSSNIFSMPNNNSAGNKPFSFGGGGSTAAAAANTTIPSANTFSLANNNNNNQSNLFSFGASNASNTTPAEAPKANNSFSFANNNNVQSKPLSFGAANAEGPKPPVLFGSANNTIATAETAKANNSFSFGAANNTFNFGGIANKPNTQEPPKIASIIPTTNNNAATNNFSFGQSTFGSSAPSAAGQNNIFSFSGSNNNNNNNVAAAANVTATKSTNQPTLNAFSMGAQTNAFTFGGGASNAAPATAIKPIIFGTTNNNATAQSNTFVFGNGGGGSSNNNHQASTPAVASNGGNLFAMPNKNTASPSPAFGNATSAVNMFAAQPSQSQSSSTDRPIKRATRRLTKS